MEENRFRFLKDQRKINIHIVSTVHQKFLNAFKASEGKLSILYSGGLSGDAFGKLSQEQEEIRKKEKQKKLKEQKGGGENRR